MNKKISLLIFTFSTFVLMVGGMFISSQVQAAPSPSPATQSAGAPNSASASAEETTMELKKRIEKVIEKNRDKVKGAISNLLSDKLGYIGEVSRLSQEALTVKNLAGDTKIIPLDGTITIVKDGKKISADDIEVGNWVTVLGNKSMTGEFEPEYIVVSAKTLRPKHKRVLIGTITKISKTKLTILARGESEEKEYVTASKIMYENVDAGPLKASDFSKDLSILAIVADSDQGPGEITTLRSLIDVKATKK